jgi:hypothetical protein
MSCAIFEKVFFNIDIYSININKSERKRKMKKSLTEKQSG